MYHIKHDQRATRSAKTIYEALVTLMGEKPFEAIKVSELVAQAEVGRATFYRNFDAIEDVLHWRCDQILGEMVHYLVAYRQSQPQLDQLPLLKPVLRFFYLHSSIVELLIEAKRTDILEAASQALLERFQETAVSRLPNVPQEYLAYGPVMRASVAVNILIHWVKRGKQEAPDALADGLAEWQAK